MVRITDQPDMTQLFTVNVKHENKQTKLIYGYRDIEILLYSAWS